MADEPLPVAPKSTLRHTLFRQAVPFALIGAAQLVPDTACFVLLSWLGLSVPVANLCGRVVGACLGYWLNGRYTFANNGVSALGKRQFIKFWLAWSAMTLLSTAAVTALAQYHQLTTAWIGKPVIDVLLAGVGFLVSKYWIFL